MSGKKKESTAVPQKWEDVPEIPKEEQPYPLPEGWKWVYGKNIFKEEENINPTGDTFEYIDIESIDNMHQIIRSPKIVAVKNAPSRARRKLQFGDTIFSMVRPYLNAVVTRF